MHKDFIKYNKKAIKITEMPITSLNSILSISECGVRIRTKRESVEESYKYYCEHKTNPIDIKFYEKCLFTARMDCTADSDDIIPILAVGDVLGITLTDWCWLEDGYTIRLFYK